MRPFSMFIRMCGFSGLVLGAVVTAWPQEAAEPKLIPVEPKAIETRCAELKKACGDVGQLVAYLDCGSQKESVPAEGVKVTWVSGKAFAFPSDATDVPASAATVAFDESRLVFEISGLDPRKNYEAALSWWDYDDGQRTQQVTVASSDRRQVQIAIPAARLPNYRQAKQKPDTKRVALPVQMARDGKLLLLIEPVTGPNAVVSEIWIVEKK
jgi:hypothetical protein